jgi:predicted aldo/keto reductase-like oxidoreductase
MKKLGFGTMRLPTLGDDSKVDLERFQEMVDRFLEQGFTYFDTSYLPAGTGNSCANLPGLDAAQIPKCGTYPRFQK